MSAHFNVLFVLFDSIAVAGGTALQQGSADPLHALQIDQEGVTRGLGHQSDTGDTHHHQTDTRGTGRHHHHHNGLEEEGLPPGLGLLKNPRGVGIHHCLQIGLEEGEGPILDLGLRLRLESVSQLVLSHVDGLLVLQKSAKLLPVVPQQRGVKTNTSQRKSAAALDAELDDKLWLVDIVCTQQSPTNHLRQLWNLSLLGSDA